MSKDGETIAVIAHWPRSARRDGWLISQVIAVDPNGVKHVLQIIDTSTPTSLKKRNG